MKYPSVVTHSQKCIEGTPRNTNRKNGFEEKIFGECRSMKGLLLNKYWDSPANALSSPATPGLCCWCLKLTMVISPTDSEPKAQRLCVGNVVTIRSCDPVFVKLFSSNKGRARKSQQLFFKLWTWNGVTETVWTTDVLNASPCDWNIKSIIIVNKKRLFFGHLSIQI